MSKKKKLKNDQIQHELLAPKRFSDLNEVLDKKGWKKDVLSQHIEAAFCNIGTTYLNLKSHLDLMIKATEIFENIIEEFSVSDLKEAITKGLFYRSYSCFFGASRMVCSGQLTETWILARACIENMLYSFYFANDASTIDVWINRHKDPQVLKKCKRLFLMTNIWNILKEKSPLTEQSIRKHYDMTIDWGAHPNERSLFPNMEASGSGLSLLMFNVDPNLIKATILELIIICLDTFKVGRLIFTKQFEHPNIQIKIQNLQKQSSPLGFEVANQLRKYYK